MVLGIQWLHTLGEIRVDFKELRMIFKHNNQKVFLRGTHKSNMEWLKIKSSDKTMRQAELHSMALCVFPNSAASCMQIEPTVTFVHPALQSAVQAYADVFAISTELPPRREQDHKIPLVEGC